MGTDATNEDPGWPSLGRILLALVPGYLQTINRRSDPLLALRAVFVSFSGSLVLFGVVLATLPNTRPTHVMPWLALVVVVAVVTSIGASLTMKPLNCSSASTLAGSYRTRLFLAIAFSQTVALFGFCFVFIGAPRWVYDVAAVFAILRMWTLDPPTPRRLRAHQAELTAAGCELSLVGALRRSATPPPPPG